MKRNIQLFIILLLAVVLLSACDDISFLPPIPVLQPPASEDNNDTPLLTPEEIELIKEWGFGGDYVVRWPDGYVDVYDETGYFRMQEILNEWNSVIGGPVVFRLSNNPNSPVKLYCESISGYCGNRIINWNEDYTFSKIDLQINCYESDCFQPSNKYSLYLFMFKNAVGFKGWTTKGEDVPYEEWTNFTQIKDTMKKMVHALHKVPPGHYLNKEQEEEPVTMVEFKPTDGCCVTQPYNCYGCWQKYSMFGGFNLISFYSNEGRVTLQPKDKKWILPDYVRVRLEGFYKFDIGKKYEFSPIANCNEQPSEMMGDWRESHSIIAETIFENGESTVHPKYESENGYVIKINSKASPVIISIELSDHKKYAFNAVPWGPGENDSEKIVLKLFDEKNRQIGQYRFNSGIFPGVESSFGQCVWWAIKQKYDFDRTIITPPFYPHQGMKDNIVFITSEYKPQEGDIIVDNRPDNNGFKQHYAFIEKIENNRIKISQFNYPVQERKSIQWLCFVVGKNGNWSWINPDVNNGCKYHFQFNYFIR